MRDNSRVYDPNQGAPPSQNYAPPPRDYGQARNYPQGNYPQGNGPQGYGQPPRGYGPPPQDYRQTQYSNPQPQDDPRYGNLN